MTNEQIDSILTAKNNYERSKSTNMGVNRSKQQLKNVMFNCYPDLVAVIRNEANADEIRQLKAKVASLEADLASLQESLKEADNENDELRKQLKSVSDANGGSQKKK